MATDTFVVYGALGQHVTSRKRVRGTLRAVPFEHGRSDDPRQSARRALATIGVSMTPNTFVIGVDPDRDELLVHQTGRPARLGAAAPRANVNVWLTCGAVLLAQLGLLPGYRPAGLAGRPAPRP
jgi:hypothetical protein